jgi:hypothetical protein
MAGLDPANQLAHVCAQWKLLFGLSAAQTRGHWVAGSSPAMTDVCRCGYDG